MFIFNNFSLLYNGLQIICLLLLKEKLKFEFYCNIMPIIRLYTVESFETAKLIAAKELNELKSKGNL